MRSPAPPRPAALRLQFSSGKSAPAGARIVYIDGAFDLFHVGHVEILKARLGFGFLILFRLFHVLWRGAGLRVPVGHVEILKARLLHSLAP